MVILFPSIFYESHQKILTLKSVPVSQKTAITLVVSPSTSGSISEMLRKYVSTHLYLLIQSLFQISASKLDNWSRGYDLTLMDMSADKQVTSYDLYCANLIQSFSVMLTS